MVDELAKITGLDKYEVVSLAIQSMHARAMNKAKQEWRQMIKRMKKVTGFLVCFMILVAYSTPCVIAGLVYKPKAPSGSYEVPANGQKKTLSFQVYDVFKAEQKDHLKRWPDPTDPRDRGFSRPTWWAYVKSPFKEESYVICCFIWCVYPYEKMYNFPHDEDGNVYMYLEKKINEKWETVAHHVHKDGINTNAKIFTREYDTDTLDPEARYRIRLENKMSFSYRVDLSCYGVKRYVQPKQSIGSPNLFDVAR